MFYRGDALVPGGDCEVRPGQSPRVVVDAFGHDVEFQTRQFVAGQKLVSLAEGLGLRRGNPELRRFAALGQLILDPADMAVVAPHLLEEPLTYPGTGQTTGAHMLLLPSVGDMSVPVNMALSIGRSSGLLEYLEDNPDHGKPDNQLLIDTHTAEAVHLLNRYTTPDGSTGVHIDLDNFSQGTDIWGDTIPRLDPPLRIGFEETDKLGGKSTMLFAYGDAIGSHGFPPPGEGIDAVRKQCERNCEELDCGCGEMTVFDYGNFYFNLLGQYLASGGTVLSDDMCQARDDCDSKPPFPELRYNPDDPDAMRPEPMDSCELPESMVGGTPELDAVVDSRSTCGGDSFGWLRSSDLGLVTSLGTEDAFPVTLLKTLAESAGVPIPREIVYDATVRQYSYTTQDRGELIEATAMVAFPSNYEEEDPLDILLFLPEPSGIRADCATSRDFTQKALVALLATFGYVVVAPDYVGMAGFGDGGGGLNPYLLAEPNSLGALDAIRALGKMPMGSPVACVGPQVMVLGATQGGHAALHINRMAPYYAPELSIVGGVAVAPHSDLTSHLKASVATEIVPSTHRLATFFTQAAQWYGLTDSLDQIFQDGVPEAITIKLTNNCDHDVLDDYTSLDEVFTSEFLEAARGGSLSTLAPWDCVLAENSPVTSPVPPVDGESGGFLFVLGSEDELIGSDVERAAFAELCNADGARLQFLECSEAEHDDVILWALPEALDFMEARLAGEAMDPGSLCVAGDALRCTGQPE